MVVQLWTDGSSTGRVGPGGWAYLLRFGEHAKEDAGYAKDTTNNRMELQAMLEGLRALTRSCDVVVHTDSEYVMKAFTHGWIVKWERKNWHGVKNVDLWQAIVAEAVKHRLNFEWHRGHSGVPDNERVDELAREARIAGSPAPEEHWRHENVFRDEDRHLEAIAMEAA